MTPQLTVDSDAPDRFEMRDQLGKTRFATTFKAFDRRHKRLVVIKLLAHPLFAEPEVRMQVRRAVKQRAEFRHPYLLPILRAKETADGFYWVLPYMAGGNLQQRMDAGVLTQEEVHLLTQRMTDALLFLHGKGVQHLKLKPTNILFDEVGNVQLTDLALLPLVMQFEQVPTERERREADFATLHELARRCLAEAPSNTIRRRWLGVPETVEAVANTPTLSTSARRKPARIAARLSLLFLCLYLFGQFAPLIGARAAPPLRTVLGNERVAALETTLFRMQDRGAQIRYELGIEQPQAPWQPPPQPQPTITLATVLKPVVQQTIESATLVPSSSIELDVTQTASAQPAASLTAWQSLAGVPPLGTLEGEGVWLPYLTDADENVVARRTFLQPDPDRPLTVLGVVAFDLTRVELNYVLGSEEPRGADRPTGTGILPPANRAPDKLLATFNGGFMSTHGRFGAMADQVVALAPRAQLATVAIDREGQVAIGAWEETLDPTGDWRAYRQNARLIVADGAINPDVYNDSIADWGGTINSEIVTWRSAIGLNADRTILYYVAGPSLHMPALADSLIALDVTNGMLLDINPYWVHFAAIRAEGDQLRAEALFEEAMSIHIDRYLRPSERDFFYITMR